MIITGGAGMLEVYVKDGCPYCEKQLDIFNRKGLEYKLYNVNTDSEALEKARDEYKADKVPVVVDNEVVKNIGFGGGG
jgi:glutaredoxin